MALEAVVYLAVEKPLQHAVAVGKTVLALPAPGDGLAGAGERVGDTTAVTVGDPGHVISRPRRRGRTGRRHAEQQQRGARVTGNSAHLASPLKIVQPSF